MQRIGTGWITSFYGQAVGIGRADITAFRGGGLRNDAVYDTYIRPWKTKKEGGTKMTLDQVKSDLKEIQYYYAKQTKPTLCP